MQSATQGIGEYFKAVEKSPQEECLWTLFRGAAEHMLDRKITGFLVKYAGI